MMPAMSAGVQLILDEPRDRLARAHAVLETHVVVVEKNREQPHVIARRLGLLFDDVANFSRRIAADAGVLADVHQLEGLDRLRLAVFGDLEVFLPEIVDRVALLVGDDDVNADEVDVGTECRSLLRLRRRRGLGSLGGGASCAFTASTSGAARTAAITP